MIQYSYGEEYNIANKKERGVRSFRLNIDVDDFSCAKHFFCDIQRGECEADSSVRQAS